MPRALETDCVILSVKDGLLLLCRECGRLNQDVIFSGELLLLLWPSPSLLERPQFTQ